MATRFYLPSSGAADITPNIGGAWTDTSAPALRKMFTAKQSTAMASVTIVINFSSSTASTLYAQYVSAQLAAQSISGTVSGQVRMNVSNATGCTCTSMVRIYVVNNSGTVVATLFSGNSGASNLVGTVTNRNCPISQAISSYSCADTDRILIEIGIVRSAGVTSRNGNVSFGDDSATDLAVDNSTTAANNPWVEFSGNLTFYTAPSVSSRLTLLGVG